MQGKTNRDLRVAIQTVSSSSLSVLFAFRPRGGTQLLNQSLSFHSVCEDQRQSSLSELWAGVQTSTLPPSAGCLRVAFSEVSQHVLHTWDLIYFWIAHLSITNIKSAIKDKYNYLAQVSSIPAVFVRNPVSSKDLIMTVVCIFVYVVLLLYYKLYFW